MHTAWSNISGEVLVEQIKLVSESFTFNEV